MRRVRARLQRDEVVVVVARYAAVRPDQHEPAFRLRLLRPRVGKGAPARLELRQATPVAADGDRLLVHLDAKRLVDDACDFKRRLAVHEPGPERHAIAKVVEQAPAARRFLVPPGVWLLPLDLIGRDLLLAGKMEERTT